MAMTKDGFRYDILKSLGVIREVADGWTREINIVSWNGKEPKYDIRDWNKDHTDMSRGITLTSEEFKELVALGCEYLSASKEELSPQLSLWLDIEAKNTNDDKRYKS